jgi:HK97 family phage major capsid protein
MKFIKKLKEILERGYASAEEKQAIKKELEEQEQDVQDVAKEDVEKVDELPEENPEDGEVEQEVEKAMKKVFDGEKSSLKKDVLAEVQKLLDAHKEKMAKKVGVYSTEAKKDAERQLMNKYLREGLLSVVNGAETKEFGKVKAEMTTDSTGTPYSGYITHDYLDAEIRHLMTQYGVAAREMTTVSFMNNSYKANNLATDVTVYWVDEGGSIKSTQAVLGQGTLDLKKLAAIVTLTRELLQEQEIDFVSFLGERVAEGFAQAEDEAFFIGDGTSTYGSFTGLLENGSVNEVTLASGDTAFSNISVEKLRAMQDATPQGALANAKYYMHRSILTYVRNLREDAISAGDGAGAFIWKAAQGTEPANIDGYPIVLVEAMPSSSDSAADTSFVLFGDLRKACLRGVRGGIVADRFNAGAVRNIADSADINLITTDREAVRWITQVGYLAIIPSAVTKLTTAAASA